LNNVILQFIRQTQDPAGVSVQTLAAQMGKSEMDIRSALEFLAGEGQVYSTVDEGKNALFII
jgi:DeoR/GlpR family transcriptional regulator of sugar metabolism